MVCALQVAVTLDVLLRGFAFFYFKPPFTSSQSILRFKPCAAWQSHVALKDGEWTSSSTSSSSTSLTMITVCISPHGQMCSKMSLPWQPSHGDSVFPQLPPGQRGAHLFSPSTACPRLSFVSGHVVLLILVTSHVATVLRHALMLVYYVVSGSS